VLLGLGIDPDQQYPSSAYTLATFTTAQLLQLDLYLPLLSNGRKQRAGLAPNTIWWMDQYGDRSKNSKILQLQIQFTQLLEHPK